MAFQLDFVCLLKAIKERKSIDIFYEEKDGAWNYFSRFLELSSEGQSFIVDLPVMLEDTYKPLKPGYIIYIIFKIAGFRFQFATTVQEQIQYILENVGKVPALRIAWPREIIEENRRSFFRAELSMDESIDVNYTILSAKQQEKLPGESKRNEYGGVEAILADVSENGLGIRINREKNLKINVRVRLDIRLKDLDDEHIEIEGIVRHIQEYEGKKAHLCGIEFLPEDSSKRRQAVRKMIFYLMTRHQENVSFLTVDSIISKNPIVQRIVNGEISNEMLDMLLNREFSLSDEEYLESLVYVLQRKEHETRAQAILESIPMPVKEKYIKRVEANHRVAYYLLTEGINHRSSEIIAAVIENRYLPVEFWLKIAREGTEPMLKLLLANENRLIAYPEILEVMKKNPHSTPVIKMNIHQISKYYLVDVEAGIIPREEVIANVQEAIMKQTKANGEKSGSITKNEARREAIFIINRINKMSVRERIRLAFCGEKTERMVLNGDPHEDVLLSLVESPWIGEDEILIILQNPGISAKVVQRISDDFFWQHNYSIILSLVKHPKLPVKNAPRLIEKLKREDLKEIVINKEIHPEILYIAEKIFEKTILKKPKT